MLHFLQVDISNEISHLLEGVAHRLRWGTRSTFLQRLAQIVRFPVLGCKYWNWIGQVPSLSPGLNFFGCSEFGGQDRTARASLIGSVLSLISFLESISYQDLNLVGLVLLQWSDRELGSSLNSLGQVTHLPSNEMEVLHWVTGSALASNRVLSLEMVLNERIGA